jgi:3-oxoadipate enol-lactonase/4-carboxymuconolactone decarboxylase
MLLNSLGTDMGMWDPQLAPLGANFDILRMDTRGHGSSDVPEGDYSLEMLGLDALAVMDAAGVDKAIIIGLSLGGMTAMWLAANHPDRFTALVVCNSSAKVAPGPWDARARLVRSDGMDAVVDAVIERFYSPDYRTANPAAVATAKDVLRRQDPVGYSGCCCAIRDMDIDGVIGGIILPTLVISGSKDTATPLQGHGDRIGAAIPGAQAVTLDAGHISNQEQPDAFNKAMLEFLDGVRGTI